MGQAIDLHAQDVNLNVLPTFHIGGLGLYAAPTWHAGGKLMANSYRPAQHHYITKAPLCEVLGDNGTVPPHVRSDVCNTLDLSCAPASLSPYA